MNAKHVFPAVVLAVVAAVVFWRWSLHPGDLLVGPQDGGRNDVTAQILPFRQSQGRAWTGDGHFAWNPYALGGMPWLGNPQTALFYPPNWLYGLCDARRALSWLLVAHHWLAGLGTYLLCRRYGFHGVSAVAAGICFMGAPYYVANTGEGHYNPVCLMAWVPWAFWAVERLRDGQRGGVALTAIVLAMCFFCGHVQELFYLVLAVTGFLVWHCLPARLSRARKPGSDMRASSGTSVRASTGTDARATSGARVLGRWALAGVVLAGLVAVDLIPIGIYSRHSVRLAGVALEDVSQGSIGPVNLLQLLDPLVLGGPSDYWGPGLYYWETVCHFGVLPLALAAVGAVGGFRRYPVARFAVLWVVAVLFALGDNTPLFPFLYRFVPGVSLFRAPSRALFFCSFCGAVLAGAGLDYLLAQAGRVAEFGRIPGRRLGLLGVVAALAVAGVFAWPWLQPDEAASTANANSSDAWQLAVQGLDPLRLSLWASGTLLVLCLFAVGGRWSRYAVSGALVLIVAELACHAGAVLRTIPAGSLRAENPVREFLQREAGLSRVFVGQELLSDREAWQHGIHKVQGYDPVPLARLGMYASALLPRSDAAQQMAGFVPFRLEDLRKPLADAFGIRYAVLGGESVKDVEGWRLVQRGRVREEVALRGRRAKEIPYAIYENETVLPRAYVVGRGVPVDPQGDVLRQLSTLDPRQQVLLPADVLPSGPRASFSPASIVHYAPSRVTVQVALADPGYLVLTDLYYAGWTAVVDGKPARVLPAHAAFRAVALERGKHTVDFVYSPPGAKLGAGISLLTLLALALAWRKSRGADVPAGRCDRQGELES